MKKCEYCGKLTNNRRFCSLKCSGHIVGKISGKIGGKRAIELHPDLPSRRGKIGGRKAAEKHKKKKTGLWNPNHEIQSKGGKKAKTTNKKNKTAVYNLKVQIMGGKAASKINKKNKTSVYSFEVQSMGGKIGGKIGGVISQKILRQNIRNLKYKDQYYDSPDEIEISICLQEQYNYKPEEGINLHIRMKGGEIDFLIENLKLFIEEHIYYRGETYEHYFKRRRKILDNNGYKDYELIVIK